MPIKADRRDKAFLRVIIILIQNWRECIHRRWVLANYKRYRVVGMPPTSCEYCVHGVQSNSLPWSIEHNMVDRLTFGSGQGSVCVLNRLRSKWSDETTAGSSTTFWTFQVRENESFGGSEEPVLMVRFWRTNRLNKLTDSSLNGS